MTAAAQHSSLNFHKLDLQDGLHDGTVRCIGQDKFGYIWLAVWGAINRFDGKICKAFNKHTSDSTFPMEASHAICILIQKGDFGSVAKPG
jgi:ligand-binding sensor domain-containing protein